MASTNQTTHYELSQYIGTDKPTYLVDYNGDMAKIDSGIYGAKSEADTNTASIGTLSNLGTTEKSNLVGAINEVNTQTSSNTLNIATNTTNITALNGKVGELTNLDTSNKTNLVSAVNEVLGLFDNFNLTNTQQLSLSVDRGTLNYSKVYFATNSNNSIFKLYGSVTIQGTQTGVHIITAQTSLRPSSNYTIYPCGIVQSGKGFYPLYMDVKTTGVIEIEVYKWLEDNSDIVLFPCLYFNSDFGDTPNQQ